MHPDPTQDPERCPDDAPGQDPGAHTDGRPDGRPAAPAVPEETDAHAPVVVTVVRTGGIAGMRRQWRAEPEPDDAGHWVALIEDCPWDDPGTDPEQAQADRFVWSIAARTPAAERTAALGDTELSGPWRTLVDEVRERGVPGRPSGLG